MVDVFFVEEGISYFGTQDDVWDAQKEMSVAFLGVVIAAVLYHVYKLIYKTKT